jgi:hypothetical protein
MKLSMRFARTCGEEHDRAKITGSVAPGNLYRSDDHNIVSWVRGCAVPAGA